MECYEDMFKDIPVKICSEEETDGMMAEYENLSTLTTIQSPSTSFTTNLEEDNWVSSEEVIPWTTSKIASYSNVQQLFRCNECECVGYLSRVAEHWLGTHANLRVFQCPQCPYASAWARCVRMHLARQHNFIPDQNLDPMAPCWKENPVLEEVTKFLQRLKNKVELEARSSTSGKGEEEEEEEEGQELQPQEATELESSMSSPQEDAAQPGINKRYNCRFCPYATDRRDLYTRHENIHRDDKPFHCYICMKHFNRADHVKKHFVRMHRDVPYDINRIKRETNKDNVQTFFEAQPKAVTPVIPIKQEVVVTFQAQPIDEQTQVQLQEIQQVQEVQTAQLILQEEPSQEMTQTETQAILQPTHVQIIAQEPRPRKEKLPKKKPGEKRYTCCYCSWSGVDNWCLKRHLNTHLKPYICSLCEYKAARSERLATHMYKVHNKRSCSKCSFAADDQAGLISHQQQNHPSKNSTEARTAVLLTTEKCTSPPLSTTSFKTSSTPLTTSMTYLNTISNFSNSAV